LNRLTTSLGAKEKETRLAVDTAEEARQDLKQARADIDRLKLREQELTILTNQHLSEIEMLQGHLSQE
jgi:hypothetical protein